MILLDTLPKERISVSEDNNYFTSFKEAQTKVKNAINHIPNNNGLAFDIK